MAVVSDDYGIVLLASPNGERYRAVDRLAMTAAEAGALYSDSSAPVLSSDELGRLYGDHIAKLKLGSIT